jgi:hypothetical protein
MRVLMLGAVLSAASNLMFAWLWAPGADVNALIFVISADNLAGGIASAALSPTCQPDECELFGHAVRAVQLP